MLATVRSLELLFQTYSSNKSSNTVSSKRFERNIQLIEAFDAEVVAGKIYNVTATEAKDALGVVQDLFQCVHDSGRIYHGSPDAEALGDLYYELPYSIDGGTYKKAIRNLELALKNTSISAHARANFEQQLTIVKAFGACAEELKAVKDKLIKGRKVVHKEGEDAGFVNRIGSMAAVELVRGQLSTLVKPHLDSFESRRVDMHQRDIAELESLGAEFAAEQVGAFRIFTFQRCFTFKIEGYGKKAVYKEVKRDAAADTYPTTEAKKERDAVEASFINKNVAKLSNLLDKKGMDKFGGLAGAASINGNVIEATLVFTFTDGSIFVVKSKVITNRTARGDWFYQYPTTFHNVKLPSGESLTFPSEEKMIKEFTKA